MRNATIVPTGDAYTLEAHTEVGFWTSDRRSCWNIFKKNESWSVTKWCEQHGSRANCEIDHSPELFAAKGAEIWPECLTESLGSCNHSYRIPLNSCLLHSRFIYTKIIIPGTCIAYYIHVQDSTVCTYHELGNIHESYI